MTNDTAGKVSASRRGQELHGQPVQRSPFESIPQLAEGSWKRFVFILLHFMNPHAGLGLDSAASGVFGNWTGRRGGSSAKKGAHSSHLFLKGK